MKIEVDLPDGLVKQVRAHVDRMQILQRDAQVQWDHLLEPARGSVLRPESTTEEDFYRSAFLRGVEEALYDGHAPNSVLGLGVEYDRGTLTRKQYQKGQCVRFEVCLPIGAEVLAATASEGDGPNWDVTNFCFGTMNLINPQGSGPVPLSELLHLTTKDVLSVFDGKRTKVDVTVGLYLVCRMDGATFDGYRLHLRQEEQLCAIAARVEDTAHAPLTFPQERVGLWCAASVSAAMPTTKLRSLLDQLNEALRDVPGVWSDGSRAVLHDTIGGMHCIKVRACLQARTEQQYETSREAVLLRLRGVLDGAGASFSFGIGRTWTNAWLARAPDLR